MLIQCPKCQTTYKVSDEVMKGKAPAFCCSRCRHTFEVEAADTGRETEEETAAEDSAPTRQSRNETELPLPFAPKTDVERIAGEPAQLEALAEQSEFVAKAASEPSEASGLQEEPWAMSDAKREDEQPFVMPAEEHSDKDSASEDFSIDDDPIFRRVDADSENPQNVLAISPYLEQRASILPYVSLLVFLVVGFGLFTIVSRASPQTPESILKNIPVLGPLVLKNNHLKEGILIK